METRPVGIFFLKVSDFCFFLGFFVRLTSDYSIRVKTAEVVFLLVCRPAAAAVCGDMQTL